MRLRNYELGLEMHKTHFFKMDEVISVKGGGVVDVWGGVVYHWTIVHTHTTSMLNREWLCVCVISEAV